MKVLLYNDLKILVISSKSGKILHQIQAEMSDFRRDYSYQGIEIDGKEYDLECMDNGESLIVNLTNGGSEIDDILGGDTIPDPALKLDVDNEIIDVKEKIAQYELSNDDMADCYRKDLERLESINSILKGL